MNGGSFFSPTIRAAKALSWPPILVPRWYSFGRTLAHQIRIEGHVEKVTTQESDDYFGKRPFGHRLGALVSSQSKVVAGRSVLEKRMEELLEEYREKDVPRRSTGAVTASFRT